ncbi:MAG: AraC family transcriptional regulator [Noviherbaspirillum sp.]
MSSRASQDATTGTYASEPQQVELAALVRRHAASEGVNATAIAPLHLIRMSEPTEPIHAIHEPALCIVVQGRKQVWLADECYLYDRAQYLVVSVDLPVIGQVVQATAAQPYLCLRVDLEPKEIAELLMSVEPLRARSVPQRGLFLSEVRPTLLDAVLRLARLLDTPRDIPVLAPMALREILYRLLQDEQGKILRQIAASDSHAQTIARAIGLIKRDYRKPLRIDALAREVNMSTSSLHHHFKTVTAMTPIQYQKQLRLQEARRLLLAETNDAATAGHLVGYESASQFSREYSRLFGAPPARDVARLRAGNRPAAGTV